jgi:hypothetical protein
MSTSGGYGQQGPENQSPGGYEQPGAPVKKAPNMAVYWAITIVAVLGLSVAGYFFGRSQGQNEYDPGTSGYQAIYQTGYKAGQTGGEASGKASGEAAGTAKGKAAGEAAGKQAGLEQGKQQGAAQGTAAGATAALGGFSSWQTNTPYAVNVDPGTQSGVPYVISSRVLMASDTYYSPCESDPSTICTFPRPPAGSGGGTASAGTDTTSTTGGN